jgi:hypothetical protein
MAITTFLFTDIEGSTRLWEQDPERMRLAQARHDALLRSAVETHDGRGSGERRDETRERAAIARRHAHYVRDLFRRAPDDWKNQGQTRISAAEIESDPIVSRRGDHVAQRPSAARILASMYWSSERSPMKMLPSLRGIAYVVPAGGLSAETTAPAEGIDYDALGCENSRQRGLPGAKRRGHP